MNSLRDYTIRDHSINIIIEHKGEAEIGSSVFTASIEILSVAKHRIQHHLWSVDVSNSLVVKCGAGANQRVNFVLLRVGRTLAETDQRVAHGLFVGADPVTGND